MTEDRRQPVDERQAVIERLVRLPLPLIDIHKVVKLLPDAWLQEFFPPPKPWWRRWLAKLRSLTEG